MKNAVISISLLIMFVSFSMAKSIYQNQTAEIKKIKESISEEQQKSLLLKRIAETESKIKRYSHLFSSTKENRWLLRQLSSIADQTGVSLISITPRLPKEGDKYVLLSVVAEIRCDYDQFGNFISKLESSPQLIRLDDVRLTVIRESREGLDLAAQLKPLANVKLIVSTLYLK